MDTIQNQEFFQKNRQTQMVGPILLYTHAKNWKDPWSRFGEKAKNHHTDGWTEEWTGVNLKHQVSGSNNLQSR